MINQGNNVPDKTIAVFTRNNALGEPVSMEQITKILSKPTKTREWFTPHHYRCLPLTIGNQYGFVISSEFSFSVIWDGGPSPESLKISSDIDPEDSKELIPRVSSHFGSGILTVSPPFILRTPPGINLMTINPPNHVLPNVTVMTGVVETDNLRRNFTFNLKIQIPNIQVNFPAGVPLSGFIPIPRYFADEFVLKDAQDLFSIDTIVEEYDAADEAERIRATAKTNNKYGIDRNYLLGKDPYGNPFPDHQSP